MQPHDTQQLPAYDRPGVQNVEPQRRGPTIGLIAGLVVLVLVLGLVGLEFGLRNSIKRQMAEEITTALGSPAQVKLGGQPVLLSYFNGTLGTVHVTTDGSPAEGANGPAPKIDVRAEGIRAEGDVTHVDSLSGTAFVSDEAMSAAAATDQGTGDSMLGGLIQVQNIVSDPAAGTLRVSISGLAEAVVTPRLVGGNLEMKPEQATIFGFTLPSELLGGTVSMMDSTLAELPEGVQLTGVRVVPGGMTVDLAGTDVVLEPTR